MNDMQAKYADHGFKILAVNVDNERKDAMRFLEKVPANFQIAYDPKGELASSMKLKAMPSSFLINPDGRVIETHLGFIENDIADYEKEIRRALNVSTTEKTDD